MIETLNQIIRVQDIGGNYHYRCETMTRNILITRAQPHKYLELTTDKTSGEQIGEFKFFKSEKQLRGYLTDLICIDSEG